MEFQTDSAYQKLARTPLARSIQICGLEPKTVGIILGGLSLIIDVLPAFYIAYYVYNLNPEVKEEPADDPNDPFNDPFFKKHRKKGNTVDMTSVPRMIAVAFALIFAFIQLIGIICVFVGACRDQARYFYCWCCTMICQGFMGKFSCVFFLFIFKVDWAPLLFILLVLDIFLGIAMVYCMGQMAAVERNKRYLSMGDARYHIQPADPQAGQKLIGPPPGAYPHQ